MAVDPPFNPLGAHRGDKRRRSAAANSARDTHTDNVDSNPLSIRREAIQVLRAKGSSRGSSRGSSGQVRAPPCSVEMDVFCGSVRDEGGGTTYGAVQHCLRANFTQLGVECQLFTRAAELCDFAAIREVCTPAEATSGVGAAACVERVSALHARGRAKVPRSFLNFSHPECAKALRDLPQSEPAFEEERFDGAEPLRAPEQGGARIAVGDDEGDAAAPRVEVAVVTAAEFEELWARDQAKVFKVQPELRVGRGDSGGEEPRGEEPRDWRGGDNGDIDVDGAQTKDGSIGGDFRSRKKAPVGHGELNTDAKKLPTTVAISIEEPAAPLNDTHPPT